MIVAFDFDKTLIDHDSLFGFYKRVHGDSSMFKIKRYCLLFFAVLYKLGILSNTRLKQIGVDLFVQGTAQDKIESLASSYAKDLQLNAIYTDFFLLHKKQNHHCLVVSAGFLEYIQKCFPDDVVLASELAYNKGAVSGIKTNLYGMEKVHKLQKLGFDKIDVFYTDSYADKPLMEISKKVCIVKKGKVVDEFVNP
jgi:HAD superfamily phosphoserine phosphatase-like hydrolase